MADQTDPAPTADAATADPGRAGTAPVDPTNIAPGVDADRMQDGADIAAEAASAAAVPTGPIGGEATVAATAWGGERDGEG